MYVAWRWFIRIFVSWINQFIDVYVTSVAINNYWNLPDRVLLSIKLPDGFVSTVNSLDYVHGKLLLECTIKTSPQQSSTQHKSNLLVVMKSCNVRHHIL